MRILRFPDFGFRRSEEAETIKWTGPQLPSLDGKHWNRMKVGDRETGTLYCLEVKCLKFVRNTWTQIVQVEFDYKAGKYCDRK